MRGDRSLCQNKAKAGNYLPVIREALCPGCQRLFNISFVLSEMFLKLSVTLRGLADPAPGEACWKVGCCG